MLHGVVESQSVLGDELQDHRGGEGLGDATGAELQLRPHRRAGFPVGVTGRPEVAVRTVVSDQKGTWVGVRGGSHLVGQLLQGRVTTAGGPWPVMGLTGRGHTGWQQESESKCCA
ncbi:hypothetical protein GCM10023323_23450 [Streptomyces thinghirensis]|uniref:Uncharacterized protein n=1 Tax=Streptomyces thinghirensis TaxID=551547 RepID=A0ABP9SZU3_9ACTN